MNNLLTKICIFSSLVTLLVAGVHWYREVGATPFQYLLLALTNSLAWFLLYVEETT